MEDRIWLSPPTLTGEELDALKSALDSGWIAPMGPLVDRFEGRIAQLAGSAYAIATVTGTAAIHLGLRLLGVGPGDEVICPTLTFVASANPAQYLGARVVFVDSLPNDYHLDPMLVEQVLAGRQREGKLPKAVIVPHLYGLAAGVHVVKEICDHYGVPVLEDAAEALGVRLKDKPVGSFGSLAAFSFNGNKLVTTSAGGALVDNNEERHQRARFLAQQAREDGLDFQSTELGYNYRLSNLLAAVGLAQLESLKERIAARRALHQRYFERLGQLPGVYFMPPRKTCEPTRWLTTIQILPEENGGVTREVVQRALTSANIECRPVWKPLHLQPVYQNAEYVGGTHAETFFRNGLVLPSGALTDAQFDRVCGIIESCWQQAAKTA